MLDFQELTEQYVYELQEIFNNIDLSLIKYVIYFDCWNAYDSSHGIFIFQAIDDSYQMLEYGSNVFGNYYDEILHELKTIGEINNQIEIFNYNKKISEENMENFPY